TASARRRLPKKSSRSSAAPPRRRSSDVSTGDNMPEQTDQHRIGKVIQIIGPALDIEFEEGHLPPIYNAIRIVDNGELGKVPIDVVAEVANHIGESQVRCIAMKPTDG